MIRFLLGLQRSCESTSQLHQTPWLYWSQARGFSMSAYTDGATHASLPFPPSPFFLLQNFFLYSCLGPTLSVWEYILYILRSNTWSKDSRGGQERNQACDPLCISSNHCITRLRSLKSPGVRECRQIPTAQLRIAQPSKIPPNFFIQSLNRAGMWNMLVLEA